MAIPRWLQILADVGPKVLQFTPLAPIAPYVSAGIAAAQAIPGASNADKLAHVTEIARDSIAATNAQAGHIVVSPALSDAVIHDSISAVVQAINATHGAVDLAHHPLGGV